MERDVSNPFSVKELSSIEALAHPYGLTHFHIRCMLLRAMHASDAKVAVVPKVSKAANERSVQPGK